MTYLSQQLPVLEVQEIRTHKEIGRYRETLAGVAETHHWLFHNGSETTDFYRHYRQTNLIDFSVTPEEVMMNARLENSVPEYIGPIDAEEALGRIMTLKAFLEERNYYQRRKLYDQLCFTKRMVDVDVSPEYL